jgi:hypothetical protein
VSQQINLYDAAFRKESKSFSAGLMAVSLAAIVAAFAVLHFYVARQVAAIERVVRDSDNTLATLRTQLTGLAPQAGAPGSGQLLNEELARLEARLKARQGLLQEVTLRVAPDAEGYSGLLTGFARRAQHGVWLTGIAVNEARALEIKGRVLDAALVPVYLRSLNVEAVIRGRSVDELALRAREEAPAPKPAAGSSDVARPARYVEFAVKLRPKGEASAEAVQ